MANRRVHTAFLAFYFLMNLTAIKSKTVVDSTVRAHYTATHHELHRSLIPVYTELHDFEVAIPEMVDVFGNHVSHNIHQRVRRNTDKRVKYLKIEAHGLKFHMALTPKKNLLHPTFTATRIRRDVNGKQHSTVENVDVELGCIYEGKLLSHSNGPALLSLCHGTSGLLRTRNDDFIIEPIPPNIRHNFTGDQEPHVIYKKKHIGRNEQHYCGGARPHPMPVSKENEIEYRYFSDGSFIISPVNVSSEEVRRRRMQLEVTRTRSKRDAKPRRRKIVETLVVADHEFLRKHSSDRTGVTTYILTVMNMADGLFKDGTLDSEIEVVLIGLILLDADEDLDLGHRAGKSLAEFCKWQSTLNMTVRKPDHAILLTGINICVDRDEPCDTLGLAEVGGMCNPLESCTINEDSGLGLAFTVAHETGHSFGMAHDGQGNACLERGGHIMSPTINAANGVFTWSSCSRKALEDFLKTDQAQCVQDTLEDFTTSIIVPPHELPGQLYSADEQCKLQFGRDRRVCTPRYGTDPDHICVSLWCQQHGGSCESKHLPVTEGTPCADHKWCRRGKCVAFGTGGPEPINGGWSDYGPWSKCSRSCGVGVSMKVRRCDNPAPMYGGRHCDGDNTVYELCNTIDCPTSAFSYRAEQCAEYNSKPYRSQYFDWIPYTKYWKYGTNRCELLCEAEGYGFFDRLSPRVKDGTSCDEDSNDVCIAGKCEAVGCDKVLHSNEIRDVCGICKGNNSTCRVKNGSFTDPVPDSGYYFVERIPIGAATIRIWENDYRSHAYLAVKSAVDESCYYLNGNWEVDMYEEKKFAGSKWEYRRMIGEPEMLRTNGPINEPLVIESLIVNKNPGISYSYYIPEIDNALPHEIPKSVDKPSISYVWKEEFSKCSASCAGGLRGNNVTCRKNGIDVVLDSDCPADLRPRNRTRRCNTRPCPGRWEEGPWTPCDRTCGEGVHTRSVLCIQTTVLGEKNISSLECNQKRKPSGKKSCQIEKCPQWRPGHWSKCSKTCGRGQRTRLVFCRANDVIYTNDKCEFEKRPRTKRGCRLAKCRRSYRWLISAWEECSATCGNSVQRRRVICGRKNQHGGYEPAKRKRCKGKPRPRVSTKQRCSKKPCIGTTPFSDSVVLTNQTESFVYTGTTPKRLTRPSINRPRWLSWKWEECSKTCGGGTQTRRVRCMNGGLKSTDCDIGSKPRVTQDCNTNACLPQDENEFCIDRYSWCDQVLHHRTCGVDYFMTLCCKSCISSQQIDESTVMDLA